MLKGPAAGGAKAGLFLAKNLSSQMPPIPQASPRENKKINLEEVKGEKTKGDATKQPAAPKIGTLVDFKITFFPHESDDKIIYLKNLHMFTEDNWLSLGLKPRAKDIKSVIEDI